MLNFNDVYCFFMDIPIRFSRKYGFVENVYFIVIINKIKC